MPLVDQVGRRSWKAVLGFGATYAFLILGSVSMVYPFAIMLGASVCSSVDYGDFSVFPAYLHDDLPLYRKVLHDRYSSGYWGSARDLRRQYHRDLLEVAELGRPETGDEQAVLRDWDAFSGRLPAGYRAPGHMRSGYEDGRVQRLYRKWLAARYDNDIGRYNRFHRTVHSAFSRIQAPYETPAVRDWTPPDTPAHSEWLLFRATIPPSWFVVPSLEGLWQQFLLGRYQSSIADLNQAWEGTHSDFWRIPLPAERPSGKAAARDWDDFVLQAAAPRYVSLSPASLEAYRETLVGRHESIDRLNQLYGTAYAAFADIPLPADLADESRPAVVRDILALLERPDVRAQIRLVDPDNRWRSFLRDRYGSVARLNAAHGTGIASFEEAAMPNAAVDWRAVRNESRDWRRYFLFSNYEEVYTFLLKHGRALLNTLIYCAAMVGAALLINPLCAYALSRFSLSYANRILIFLLATMAFPGEVAMIPNFLLLRDLGLLNTYWALILPGLASGYSIFLLKGFFDSLPKELYEAAVMDGASEMTIFWRITLPLARPVLAYLGLGAFTAAYQAFMFAMVTCPDPKRWTVMVFLYDMRNWATPSATMAALVLASLPTLLIFVFAQKVIMRGIVIPIDK